MTNKILGSHWATKEEISRFLKNNEGFILGSLGDKELTDDSYMSVLLLAPTGTGKGVACIVPNLLNWKESVIVNDIRGENFKITKYYREKVLKQKIFIWEPNNAKNSHSYNPLDVVMGKPNSAIYEINRILEILFKNKKTSLDEEAKNLISVIILYIMDDKNSKKTMGEVFRILTKSDLIYFLQSIMNNANKNMNPMINNCLNNYLTKNVNEQNAIKNRAITALELWSDPNIDKTTEKSDFSLKDFNKNRSSLYILLSPNDLERLQPLLNIFYSQFILGAVEEEPFEKNSVGTLMILDEFATFGKLDNATLNAIAYTRGNKLKLNIIAQNIDQLKLNYDDNELNVLLSNIPFKICFSTENYNTKNYISNLFGDEVIVDNNGNKTVQKLLLPQEVASLDTNNEVIYLSFGNISVKCNKLKYYEVEKYRSRLEEKKI